MALHWKASSKPVQVLFQRDYVERLDGDVIAALMLSQIFYWFRPPKSEKSKIHRQWNGKFWLVKSYTDWERELGISPKQARRARAVLEARGLIEVEVVPDERGSTETHIRLLSNRVTEIYGRQFVSNPEYVFPGPTPCPTGHPPMPVGAPPHALQGIHIDYVETKEESKDLAQAPSPEPDQKESTQQQEPAMPSLDDVMKKFEPSAPSVKTKEVKMNDCILLWKKHHALNGQYFKGFSGKELGQLKHVFKKLGDDTCKVIDHCLTDWPKFVGVVNQSKGLDGGPQVPQVGYLAAHYEVAVQLIASTENQKPKSAIDKPDSPAKLPPSVPVSTEDVYQASDEEVSDLLSKLGATKE